MFCGVLCRAPAGRAAPPPAHRPTAGSCEGVFFAGALAAGSWALRPGRPCLAFVPRPKSHRGLAALPFPGLARCLRAFPPVPRVPKPNNTGQKADSKKHS